MGSVYDKGLRIDDYMRTEVIGLFLSSLSYNEISLKTYVSKSTCFKIVQEFSKTGSVLSVAKKTRSPTKLTKEVCTFIEFEKTKNPTIYTREIQSKLLESGVCTEDKLPSLTLIKANQRPLAFQRAALTTLFGLCCRRGHSVSQTHLEFLLIFYIFTL